MAIKYTKGEEIFNAVSHIIGGAFGIVALVLGIIFAIKFKHDNLNILSVIIYGVSMIILYTMSSIYHFLRRNRAKKLFRIFDHCTIFLLIAGTYTPIVLLKLNTVLGWWMFGIVWFLAIIGIVLNSIDLKKYKTISMILYLVMGWCIIFSFKNLLENMNIMGILFSLLGGIIYTIGAVLYGIGKKKKYMHSVFHIFCIIASVSFFVTIYFYAL